MYRLEIQAQWPLRFDTLAGVIFYIGSRGPLWYVLEQWDDADGWVTIVSREESRFRRAMDDNGVEDRS